MEPQSSNIVQPSQPDTPTTPTPTPPPIESQHPEPPRLTERAEKLKRLSIQVMVGGLIGAALLAVIAVLAGSFNDTFRKALFTLFLVIVHSLVCLAFIEQTGKPKKSSFRFFENAVFAIIVLSFFTSILGVWGLLAVSVVAKLYGTYFVLLFACLHGQMLVGTRGIQSSIDKVINVNYAFMAVVIALILPIIWSLSSDFPSFYYRLLAACGIVDATLTILSVILNRLYVQKHPQLKSALFGDSAEGQSVAGSDTQVAEQKRHLHPLIWLLIVLISGQVIVSVLFAIYGAFYRH